MHSKVRSSRIRLQLWDNIKKVWKGILLLILTLIGERLFNPMIDLASGLITGKQPSSNTFALGMVGLLSIAGASIVGFVILQRVYKWAKAANEALQKASVKTPEAQEPEATQLAVPIALESGTFAAVGPNPKRLFELFPDSRAHTNGLSVHTRAEIEEKLPFDSFVSQVKRGGELMFLARAFHTCKTETIKRLIQKQGVTVTILMLSDSHDIEWRKQLMMLEADFNRAMLYSHMQGTFVALCQLRRELKDEEKPRLVVMGYEKTPFLSLIVIDPKSKDAVMQIGNYISGTDPSGRLQVVLSKRTKKEKDVFDRYWKEYLSICEDASPVDLESIGGEFLS